MVQPVLLPTVDGEVVLDRLVRALGIEWDETLVTAEAPPPAGPRALELASGAATDP